MIIGCTIYDEQPIGLCDLDLIFKMSTKLKGLGVNWEIAYAIIYLFPIKFARDQNCIKYNQLKTHWPWLGPYNTFNVIQGKMSQGKLKGRIWHSIYVSYKLWSYD